MFLVFSDTEKKSCVFYFIKVLEQFFQHTITDHW